MNRYISVYSVMLIVACGVLFVPKVDAMGRCIFCGDVREEICRNCHEDLEGLPMLQMRNPDRHHVLIGTPIPPLAQSKAPDAPGGTPGEPYNCFSCHTFEMDSVLDSFSIAPFRDCLQCHPVWRVTGRPGMGGMGGMGGGGNNVHHETVTFQQRRCSVCHSRPGGLPSDGGGGGGMGMGGGGMGGGGRGGM